MVGLCAEKVWYPCWSLLCAWGKFSNTATLLLCFVDVCDIHTLFLNMSSHTCPNITCVYPWQQKLTVSHWLLFKETPKNQLVWSNLRKLQRLKQPSVFTSSLFADKVQSKEAFRPLLHFAFSVSRGLMGLRNPINWHTHTVIKIYCLFIYSFIEKSKRKVNVSSELTGRIWALMWVKPCNCLMLLSLLIYSHINKNLGKITPCWWK